MASRRKKGNGDATEPGKKGRGARGLWNGAISFSLIHIPVSLHTAARTSSLDLDLLDKRDFAPVGYQRYNKSTGKVVDWDDVVKGYEYEKGEYVVLTDEDFRRANVEASRTIDIQTFVERDAIAPYYFDTPYFLVPDKNGERVYSLLRQALEQSQKLAVATMVQVQQSLATFILGIVAVTAAGVWAFPIVLLAVFAPLVVVPFVLSRTLYRDVHPVKITDLPRFTPAGTSSSATASTLPKRVNPLLKRCAICQ